MVRTTTALNQTQKITNQRLNGNSVLVGVAAVILLTVATGRKVEILEISSRTISYGTNTTMDLNIGGQRLRRTASPAVDVNLVDIPQGKNQTLIAGETITLDGDGAGNNGSINFMIAFRETAA